MMKGRGLLLLQKVMEAVLMSLRVAEIKLRENSTTPSTSTNVRDEIPVNDTMESQKNLTTVKPVSTQVKPSYCISPVSSGSGNFDDSDADLHFKPSPYAKHRIPVIVPRKRSRSSSTTSSSSSSSSSSSNSSSSSSSSNSEIDSNSVPSAVLDSANVLNEMLSAEASTSQRTID